MPDPSTALAPITTQTVDFHGDEITGVLVQPGAPPAEWYVPLRPLCDYLGLSWGGQFERTKGDPDWAAALISVRLNRTEIAGRGQGSRTFVCLPLKHLPGWLVGITPSRVRPELADKITAYRRECFTVLWDHFAPATMTAIIPADPRLSELAEQIDTLVGTAAFLREHMAEIVAAAGQITGISIRLDQALGLLENLSTRQDTAEARLELVDERTSYLTSPPKRQIRSLIEQMVRSTKALPQPLIYAHIYNRIKHRFNVATYSELPDDSFSDLVAYLRDELRRATNGEAPQQGQLF